MYRFVKNLKNINLSYSQDLLRLLSKKLLKSFNICKASIKIVQKNIYKQIDYSIPSIIQLITIKKI